MVLSEKKDLKEKCPKVLGAFLSEALPFDLFKGNLIVLLSRRQFWPQGSGVERLFSVLSSSPSSGKLVASQVLGTRAPIAARSREPLPLPPPCYNNNNNNDNNNNNKNIFKNFIFFFI